MSETRESELLYTYEQAAQLLHVKVSWLQNEVATGAVPYRRLGKKFVRFTAADLDEIIAASRRAPVRRRDR